MPRRYESHTVSTKLSLTLTPDAAEELRRLADARALSLAEVVRRSVGLYRFVASLDADEELCVRKKDSGEIERVRFL